ncbi:MAG: zinc ribbon domain-containing protein [Armatimonadetes bacterium]|nr:zinc ribbon domain-containing protein [Armatimonadota bacterium]
MAYCTSCGASLKGDERFCGTCGAAAPTSSAPKVPSHTDARPPLDARLGEASSGSATTESVTLQIHWGGTRFLAGQFTVLVDGTRVKTSDFDKSFIYELSLRPGQHAIQTEILILGTGVRRHRLYTLSLSAGKHQAQLSYSRLWGNFEKQLQLRRL